MAEPPLPPEETPIATGIANVLKNIFKARKVLSPVTTAIEQGVTSKEVADATLEGNPELLEQLKNDLMWQAAKKYDSGNHISEYITGRGSINRMYPDNTTIRMRSGANHPDPRTGIQPESSKTIFLDEENKKLISKYMGSQGEHMKIEPVGSNKAVITRMKDYGPKKAGEVAKIKFSSRPEVGKYPFEIGMGESKAGENLSLKINKLKDGRQYLSGQHLGSKITKIINKRGGGSVTIRNPYDYEPRGI